MGKLSNEMEEAVSGELTVFYRMSGVMIQMLMFDAEQKNATLQADVAYMENYKALEQMKDFEATPIPADHTLIVRHTKDNIHVMKETKKIM